MEAKATSPTAQAAATVVSQPPPQNNNANNNNIAHVDPPPDPYADLEVKSDLAMHPLTQEFLDADDEYTWKAWRWKMTFRVKLWTLTALLGVFTALFFDYEAGAYEANNAYLAIYFVGRLLPLSVMFACLFWRAQWILLRWNIIACACLIVLVLSVYLEAFLCAQSSIDATFCNMLDDGAMLPWSSILVLTTIPFFAAFGLGMAWLYVIALSVVSLGLFIGLNLAFASNDIATPLVAWLATVLVACLSRLVHELEFRIGFKRESAMKRKLTSAIGASLSRIVVQERHQRFAEVMKRLDACLLEINADGIIFWTSSATKLFFGQEPDDIVRSDWFKTLQAEDVGGAKAVIAQLIQQGNAIAQASKPQPQNSLQAVDASLHARLRYRRHRDKDVIVVEAEAFAVVRRPVSIPGVPNPTPAGETTILLVERKAVKPVLEVDNVQAMTAEVPRPVIEPVSPPMHRLDVPQDNVLSAGSGLPSARFNPSGTTQTFMDSYDPYHERAMFTVLGCAAVISMETHSAITSRAALNAPALDRYMNASIYSVLDAISIARYRCQHLPFLPSDEFSLRTVLADACWLIQSGSDSRHRTLEVAVTLDEHVPERLTGDAVLHRNIITLALIAAAEVCMSGSVAVNVQMADAASTAETAREGREPVLRYAVVFNAGPVGGVNTVAKALAADPLRSETFFAPSKYHIENAAQRSIPAISFEYILPLLRHTVLCMGGVISLGTGVATPSAAAPGEGSNSIVMMLDLPISAAPRMVIAGPTALDSSQAMGMISAAPVDFIPPLPTSPAVRPQLPVAQPAAPMPVAGDAQQGAQATVPALNMHVLFVDDDAVNRRLGGRMLQRMGCSYVLLEDGDQVAAALRDSRRAFDAILMDILMQRTDGAVVCQELRDEGVQIAIIAMTGQTMVRDVQRFMTAGFDVVLPKPFDIWAMRKALVEGHTRRARVNATLLGPQPS